MSVLETFFVVLATVFFLTPLDCEWQAHGRLCGVSGYWRGRGGNREWRWWERCLVVKELYHLLQLYSFSTVTAKNFVPCSNPDSNPQKKVARIRHETQIHILNLLITSLELKTPNLALYLLGYEVKKPVSCTNLQDPGQTTVVGMLVFLVLMILRK